MKPYHRALLFILLFAGLGSLLSGYLTYWNYFGNSCQQNPLSWMVTCGGPNAPKIFEQPTCVYGFVMFFAVFILALIGLNKRPSGGLVKTLVTLGVVGTLFSASLSIYEIWILKLNFTTLPACVYGLVFYVGILISSILGLQKIRASLDATAPQI